MTLTPEDLTAAKVLQLPVGGAVGYLCYAPHDPAMRRLEAGLAPYPFDYLGQAVPNDGSAPIGALMFAA